MKNIILFKKQKSVSVTASNDTICNFCRTRDLNNNLLHEEITEELQNDITNTLNTIAAYPTIYIEEIIKNCFDHFARKEGALKIGNTLNIELVIKLTEEGEIRVDIKNNGELINFNSEYKKSHFKKPKFKPQTAIIKASHSKRNGEFGRSGCGLCYDNCPCQYEQKQTNISFHDRVRRT